jgi:hypothetical protein
MHTRRPWLMSLVFALLITIPGVAAGMAAGGSFRDALFWTAPLFVIWFVGGGVRRARAASR